VGDVADNTPDYKACGISLECLIMGGEYVCILFELFVECILSVVLTRLMYISWVLVIVACLGLWWEMLLITELIIRHVRYLWSVSS